MEETITTGKTKFTDEELYEGVKDLPYFKHLPLPKHWYKKFNIPVPEPVSFQTFAMERRWLEHKFDEGITYEVRNEPVPGGVRPIIEPEPIPMEVISESVSETTQLKTEESARSITPTDSTPLLSEAGPNVQSSDAE
jgi:hypothetical protein